MECLGYLKYCSLSRLTLTTSQDSQYTSETISASILPTLQGFISKHGPEIFINHFSINHSQSTQQAVTEVIFLLLYSKNSLLFHLQRAGLSPTCSKITLLFFILQRVDWSLKTIHPYTQVNEMRQTKYLN